MVRGRGVSLAFLGANQAYWQVRYADNDRTLIGYKSTSDPVTDPAAKTVQFRDLGRPECRLLGVQYNNSWKLDGVSRNYVVDTAALTHPWMVGTSFVPGDTLAATVGYEWDLITPGCATPPLTRLFTWSGASQGLPNADSVTYTAPSGARVFAAGSLNFTKQIDAWRAYGAALGAANTKLQAFMGNMFDAMVSGSGATFNATPVASFTLSATTVDPGVPVTLTDTSTDPDGTIAARAWDTDNNGVFDNGTDTTATVAFTTPGVHTVRLRVTDDAGATSVASQQVTVNGTVPPAVNLLANGSFETTLSPWSSYQGTVVREAQAGAPNGAYVAKDTASGTGSFTIDDAGAQIKSVTAGHQYQATVWVRAGVAAMVGKPVSVKLRETTTAGAIVADSVGSPVALTSGWQQITVSRVAATTGDRLGVRTSADPAAAGNTYFADDFRVVDMSTATTPPDPGPNTPPVAAFTISPASPVAGQPITLTDTSTDPDGTIAGRAWDTDNNGVFDNGTGTTATLTPTTAGTITVALRVTDNAGATTTTTRQITVAPATTTGTNLIGNWSFETALTGWSAYQGTLTRVAQTGAPDGAYVARAALASGASYTIDDGASNIRTVTVGATYTATAWVKAATTSAVGKPVNLKLRERTSGGTVVADVSGPTLTLSNSWQQLTVTRVATTAGANLGVRVSQSGATSGDAIFADAFRVTQGP
ncbi:MAG: DUF6605 domain-containing protein [Thermoleophilia bacterium]